MLTLRTGTHIIAQLIAALLGSYLLVACSMFEDDALTIEYLGLSPAEEPIVIEAGDSRSIVARVHTPDDWQGVEYVWSCTAGDCASEESDIEATIFRAPDEPDTVLLTMKAIHDGRVVGQKSIEIEVVAPGQTPSRAQRATPAMVQSPRPPSLVPSNPVPPVSDDGSCTSSRAPIATSDVAGTVVVTGVENCAEDMPATGTIDISGTGLADSTDVWTLIYAHEAGGYWPQFNGTDFGPAFRRPDGRYHTVFSLGSTSEWYDIVVVLAAGGSGASEVFRQWQIRSDADQLWPMFRAIDLPEGLREVASFSVKRGSD